MTEVAELARTGTLVERLLAGDVAALARALSILEAGGGDADRLAARLWTHAGRAGVVAFTGPPGIGKSSLISAFIAGLRARGERVAVLAVDPSSPLSGGALLGDRTRMSAHVSDDGVFIRSIASRGQPGGVALALPAMLDAVEAAGWPTVILEPVGAGQSETEIAEFADVKVVMAAPGLGDDVQALKAGLLEIADILVVNKSDLPLADRAAQQLKSMLRLRKKECSGVPVISTSVKEETGIDRLDQAIKFCLDRARNEAPEIRVARRLGGLLRRRAEAAFRARLAELPDDALDGLGAEVRTGALSLIEAERRLMELAVG